jgi:hypothetical protein
VYLGCQCPPHKVRHCCNISVYAHMVISWL